MHEIAWRDTRLTGSLPLTVRVEKVESESTACMNSSVTRTELLAFWKKMLVKASESGPEPSMAGGHEMSRPCFSSFTLHWMKSSMSGWSTLRTTILAARRVLPPDLMTPAKASKPRMKLSGPEAVPPPLRVSMRAADGGEVGAGA